MAAFLAYLAAVLTDGDTLNDWLTHLPTIARPLVLALGQLLAAIIGG